MNYVVRSFTLFTLIVTFSGCATVSKPPAAVEAPVARAEQQEAQKALSIPEIRTLKRKIAIARFTNETRYGRTLLRDDDLDPLGKQASDMLASRLVTSGKFLLFERPDLEKIEREQAILKDSNLVGVDTLILGSITEFGRSTMGKAGFLSATKKQIAHARVEIRLVDPRTGHVFFSATGSGEASTESGEIAGFGSKADYDATLNDKVFAAAISDVQNELISKLEERPWRTDILKIQGTQMFISGGKHQGIKVGDVLAVMREGDRVKSQQTGFEIALPATKIGTIRVVSLFGESEANEGSVAEILSGSFSDGRPDGLYVAEE
jgi:curli biogenesis system outer membrane secretion channel CsgG